MNISAGHKVVIIPSDELTELRLNELLGKPGIVLEDLTYNSRSVKGYMVFFSEMFNNEYVWFIPQNSVFEQD